jgi:transposase-like protein
MARVAADLGVSYGSLKTWVKQAEIDAGDREGLVSAEHDELQGLRRENRILREEHDILKKGAALSMRQRDTARFAIEERGWCGEDAEGVFGERAARVVGALAEG